MLIGHEEQVSAFQAAMDAGRLHHAWLLAGPEGVGKRAFADAMALRLLGGDAAPLVAAGSHPDFRVLEPPEEGKGAAQKIIPVEQVREMIGLLHRHAGMGGWRVVIVDAAEQVNASSSNAMLKILEEPPTDTLLLLVSHAPGRLLPTVRSRCRVLRFGRLADPHVRAVLAAQGVAPAALDALVAVADGAPGRALALADADVRALEAAMASVASGGDAVAFARQFQAPTAVPRFEALLALAPRRLAASARAAPGPVLLDLVAEADAWRRDAVRLAHDRGQVAFAIAGLLKRAQREAQP